MVEVNKKGSTMFIVECIIHIIRPISLSFLILFLIRLIPPTNEYNTTMEELSLFVGISVVGGENIWCIQFQSESSVLKFLTSWWCGRVNIGSHSPKSWTFVIFTLPICRGRLRRVQRCIMHVKPGPLFCSSILVCRFSLCR